MLKFCLAGLLPIDPGRIAGGVVHVTYLLSKTFCDRRDIEFHVVGLVSDSDANDVVEEHGAVIHRVGMPRSRFIPNLFTAGARLAPVFREVRPDVVNSHDVLTLDGALRAGCTVVHTIHGVKSKEAPHFYGRERLAARIHYMLEQRYISRASAVLSVAQYGIDCFAAGIKAPCHLINVPIEDMFFDVPEMTSCKGILFIGAIRRRKNMMAALKAMPAVLREHPDARLIACGDLAEPQYAAEIRAYVDQHGLHDAVELPGVVDRQMLCDYLKKSVCLVLPSYQETSPAAICQAMAAGRVPIASPIGGVPEMIDDGVTGFLVDADDSHKLAERLIELLSDFDKARRMGEAARAVATQRYDRHKVADRILEICSSVAAGSKAEALKS